MGWNGVVERAVQHTMGHLQWPAHSIIVASFPGSSTPEWKIELVHAERAWYFFSREHRQR